MEWIGDALQWIYDFLLWLPRKLWQQLLEAFAAFFAAIPVPGFMTLAASYASSVPAEALWALDLFAVSTGLQMVLSALLLRFLIRRLPLVG